jgi:hypothetical protein
MKLIGEIFAQDGFDAPRTAFGMIGSEIKRHGVPWSMVVISIDDENGKVYDHVSVKKVDRKNLRPFTKAELAKLLPLFFTVDELAHGVEIENGATLHIRRLRNAKD